MPLRRVLAPVLALGLALGAGCQSEPHGTSDDASYRVTIDLGSAVRDVGSDDLALSEPARAQLTAVGSAVLPVVRTALARESAEIRAGLVEVLAALPAAEREPLLIELAGNDPSEDVRDVALATLGASDDPRAADVLVRALGDPSPRIRLAAASACARACRRPDAVAGLASIASNDPLAPNGVAARKALRGLCPAGDEPCSATVRTTALETAAPGLAADAASPVALQAALLAADFAEPTGLHALMRAAAQTDLPSIARLGAIYALGSVGDARAVPVLVSLDGRDPIAAYAYDALVRLSKRGVLQAGDSLQRWSGPRPAAPLPPPLFG